MSCPICGYGSRVPDGCGGYVCPACGDCQRNHGGGVDPFAPGEQANTICLECDGRGLPCPDCEGLNGIS